MNVGRRMSRPVITVEPNTPITKVHELLTQEKIQQVPVVKKGKLVGIVSEKDILEAYPSPVTSLSVWEITSLLEKITVKDIMVEKVLTVAEDTPIEDAARMMVDNQISSLPVLRGEDLVGIITKSDLFRIMFEMLGARKEGVRFSVLIPNQPGQIAQLTQAIFEHGGTILALSTFEGDSTANGLVTVKVDGIKQAELVKVVEPLVIKLLDICTD
jgi:acetoin utilization protein AcuB